MKVTFEIVTTGQLLFKFKLQGIHDFSRRTMTQNYSVSYYQLYFDTQRTWEYGQTCLKGYLYTTINHCL